MIVKLAARPTGAWPKPWPTGSRTYSRTATPTPGAELWVAEPPNTAAAVGAYELYRVLETNTARAEDWRQMRPSGRFEVTSTSYVDRPTGPPRVMHLLDEDNLLPWVGYLYRVVARGLPGGLATRSRPSAVVRIVTLDPNPPVAPADIVATGPSTGTDLTVSWRATAPDGPAGQFRFEVLGFDVTNPSGPFTLSRGEAMDLRDPSDARRFTSTVSNRGEAAKVAVVIIDPTGRRVTGTATDVVLV